MRDGTKQPRGMSDGFLKVAEPRVWIRPGHLLIAARRTNSGAFADHPENRCTDIARNAVPATTRYAG
jgi:hypothetical protein